MCSLSFVYNQPQLDELDHCAVLIDTAFSWFDMSLSSVTTFPSQLRLLTSYEAVISFQILVIAS